MSPLIAFIALSWANLVVWAIALLCGGQLLPHTLAGFYAATGLKTRALVGGLVYATAAPGFALSFMYQPAMAGLVQCAFNAGFLVVMPILLGGKAPTLQMALAGVAVAAASLWLAHAVHTAPLR